MTAFVLSAALAFAIYQLLAFVGVPAGRNWFKIKEITITFDDASARWARRGLLAAIVVVLLLCTLFLHDVVSPADVIARSRASIVLGFFSVLCSRCG